MVSQNKRTIPLLFMKEGEQRAPWYVLSDDGKLAGIIQASTHKLNYTRMIELAENGHLSAKHIHIWFGAVGVGSITGNGRNRKSLANRWIKTRGLRAYASKSSQLLSDAKFSLFAYRFIATILFLHRPLYTFPKEPKIV